MSATVSFTGTPPGHIRRANTFDWIFEAPFENVNDHTPFDKRLPKVEDGRPIFVDEKSGKEANLRVPLSCEDD